MFAGLVGHRAEREALERVLRRWHAGGPPLHHAYLFAGREEYPRGVPADGSSMGRPLGHGQWSLALQLGAAIVAGADDEEALHKALHGLHPDLTLVEREGEVIRTEQVDVLVAELSLRPFVASQRVWIIDEADTLHTAAANKLLKSLEEPPEHVHFLLTTSRLQRVLPTIVSRCHVLELGPVGRAELCDHLAASFTLDEAVVGVIADLAEGSVARAERLAVDELSGRRSGLSQHALAALAGSHEARERFLAGVNESRRMAEAHAEAVLQAELARIAQDIPDERDRAWRERRARERARRDAARAARRESLDAIELLAALLRDLWVVSSGASEVVWNRDRGTELRAAAALAPGAYERMLEVLAAARKGLQLNVDPDLALRALFCRLEEVAQQCAR